MGTHPWVPPKHGPFVTRVVIWENVVLINAFYSQQLKTIRMKSSLSALPIRRAYVHPCHMRLLGSVTLTNWWYRIACKWFDFYLQPRRILSHWLVWWSLDASRRPRSDGGGSSDGSLLLLLSKGQPLVLLGRSLTGRHHSCGNVGSLLLLQGLRVAGQRGTLLLLLLLKGWTRSLNLKGT